MKLLKGAFGKDAQDQALNFLRKQEIDIGVGLKELIKKFNKGELIGRIFRRIRC